MSARIIQVIRKRLPGDSSSSLQSAYPSLEIAKAELKRLVEDTGPGGFAHGLSLARNASGCSAWVSLSDDHPVLEIEEVCLFDDDARDTHVGCRVDFEGMLKAHDLDTPFSAQFMGLALFTRNWRPVFAVSQLKLWTEGVRNGDIHDETIKMMATLGEPAFPAPVEPTIVHTVFKDAFGQTIVWATLSDSSECEVFRYYVDELSFTRTEFHGLTLSQARELFRKRDTAYLRS